MGSSEGLRRLLTKGTSSEYGRLTSAIGWATFGSDKSNSGPQSERRCRLSQYPRINVIVNVARLLRKIVLRGKCPNDAGGNKTKKVRTLIWPSGVSVNWMSGD
jgi:hypothetical protein